jgi:hypothetical protein
MPTAFGPPCSDDSVAVAVLLEQNSGRGTSGTQCRRNHVHCQSALSHFHLAEMRGVMLDENVQQEAKSLYSVRGVGDNRSISARSSAVGFQLPASTFALTCSGFVAPAITEAT